MGNFKHRAGTRLWSPEESWDKFCESAAGFVRDIR